MVVAAEGLARVSELLALALASSCQLAVSSGMLALASSCQLAVSSGMLAL